MYLATIPIAPTGVWQLDLACLAHVATRAWPDPAVQLGADAHSLHRHPKRESLPLPWPDKAALVVAALIAALCVIVWITTLASSGFLLYDRLDHALALWAAVAELGLALPFWLVLRFIDDVQGGPACRREALQARRIEPWFDPEPMPAE